MGKNKTLIFTSAILSKKDQQQMIEHIVANQHQRGCNPDGRALALHVRGVGIDARISKSQNGRHKEGEREDF